MRYIFCKFLILIYVLFAPGVLIAQKLGKEGLSSLKNKNILMVYGGWEGHKPDVFTQKVSSWLKEEGAKVTISTTLDIYLNKDVMDKTDLIIQYWTMGKISKEQEKALLEAVKNGTGIAGCHGGLGDSFRNNVDYQYMIGGQWVAHPGGKINYTVNIINENDPITKDLEDFEIQNTEQYYMHIDPNVQVLATTTFDGKHNSWIKGAIMPVCWKKYFDKGRVFYLSIGHNPEDFDNKAAWKLLTRGLKWASGSKYQSKTNIVTPVYRVKN